MQEWSADAEISTSLKTVAKLKDFSLKDANRGKKNLLPHYKCGKRGTLAGFSETESTYLYKDRRYLHCSDENSLGKKKGGEKVSKSMFFSKKSRIF